jgi:hypothetical protein
MTVASVLIADFPSIMNIEDAERALWRERHEYWFPYKNRPKLKRRVQNRINKYVQRWKETFYLETVEDYLILACELKDMREGRTKKREGRPKRLEDQSKRRTSQRLAKKRRKPDDTETSEANSLFDSAIDFEFDQLDQVLPSEEDVNRTEVPASFSSDTSSSDEFSHILSNDIGRTPNSISSSFFDLCNTQTLSQDSNISLLADEPWYHSDDMGNPASPSTMLHSRANPAGVLGSLQEDICARNPLDFDWLGESGNFNGSHALSAGNGDKWSGINVFEPKFNQPVVLPRGLTLGPRGGPDTHGPMKPTSGDVDCETQSSGAPHAPEKVDNGIQELREFDEAHLYTIMTELKSRLRERLGRSLPNEPVLGRQPSLKERENLAPLIEQCLITLRGPTVHMKEPKKDRTGLEDKGSLIYMERIWSCG